MKMNLKTTEPLFRSPGPGRLREGRLDEKPCRPKPTPSVRVPLTRHNREYLRALRAAELATWEPVVGLNTAPQARGNKLTFRAPLPTVPLKDTGESRLYIAISALSLAAVSYGLWNSLQLVQRWEAFVDFVGRWLG